MNFYGFEKQDFQTFQIDGLDARMEAIRERIQPKFKVIGDYVSEELSLVLGNEMYLHIAKHARRTKNPPKDTWLAISHNKRGYKSHPHFQVGVFDDHVFLWLAYIYEVPNKREIAEKLLNHMEIINDLGSKDFLISLDHTKKDAEKISNINIEEALGRFRDVKKGEILIGRHIQMNDPILNDGEHFLHFTKETFKQLVPLYKLSV